MRKHLALRVTLNSVVMILGVYLSLQTFAYLRDNILFGTSDLSALVPSVMSFVLGTVVPPMVVFGALIWLLALPIQRVARRLDRGETVDPAVLEATRLRIIRFAHYVLAINMVGFALGYVFNLLLMGQVDQLLRSDRILILLSNISAGYVYATAQTALNNRAFAEVRERLGVREIGTRKREMESARRQVIVSIALVFYALSFVQFNINDVMDVTQIQLETLADVKDGKVDPAQAAEEYRTRILANMPAYSARSKLNPEDIMVPWERDIGPIMVQEEIFYLMGAFILIMTAMAQVFYSEGSRYQLQVLIRRLKDVVAGGGDLRHRLNLTSTDDVGELTELINRVLTQFHTVVQRIDASAGETRNGAMAIAEVMDRAKAVSERTRAMVEELRTQMNNQAQESRSLGTSLEALRTATRAAEEASQLQQSLLGGTAQAMHRMSSGAHEVQDKTDQAGDVSQRLATKGREGGKAVSETAAAILEIETTARQVLGVLSALNKISASTNLLAMNAAIEAAHAGSQGIGFAVVADEVRKLAQTAGQQTMQIKSLIANMSDRVSAGVKRAEATGTVIEELVVGLEQAAGISRGISDTMRDQTSSCQEVSHSLDQVVTSSQDIGQRMADQSRASRQMEQSLGKVLEQIARLAEESEAQAQVARELDEVYSRVRAEVDRNLAAVETLSAEIRRFQT